MPKLQKFCIPEVERWIAYNRAPGLKCEFLVTRVNKDRGYVTDYVVGIKLQGGFGVHNEDGKWWVTHLSTGAKVSTPFPTLQKAARLAFCLRRLTKWRKIKFMDEDHNIPPDLMLVCLEAVMYCQEEAEQDYTELIELVKKKLPETSSYADEDVTQKVETLDDWGTVV